MVWSALVSVSPPIDRMTPVSEAGTLSTVDGACVTFPLYTCSFRVVWKAALTVAAVPCTRIDRFVGDTETIWKPLMVNQDCTVFTVVSVAA